MLPERWRNGKPVLCIPGPSLLDEAVATMVVHLVEQRGVGARAEKIDALSHLESPVIPANLPVPCTICHVPSALAGMPVTNFPPVPNVISTCNHEWGTYSVK